MTAITVHAARALLDASTANGGAIDGALLPLIRLDLCLVLVAIGVSLARHTAAQPAATLAVVFIASAGAAVAGLQSVIIPASDLVRLCASAMVVGLAVAGRRTPWWLTAIAGAMCVIAMITPAAADAAVRGADYAGSFGAALVLSASGVVLAGAAAGFRFLPHPPHVRARA